MNSRDRSGFSLLEILMATTILLGAIVVLGQLAQLGLRNAREASKMTEAQQLCRNKLEAIALRLEPAEGVEDVPLDEAPQWLYSIELEPVEREGMIAVRVTVKEDLPEQSRPTTFSLVRWLLTNDSLPDASGASPLGASSTP